MNTALLVATVDRKEPLHRLLVSLRQQTVHHFTVYIGDQNPEGYLDPVLEPFQDCLRIVRLPLSRQSLSAVRNRLIQHCIGKGHDWVCFPDDDCWYEANTLEFLEKFARSHPEADGIVCAQKDETGHIRSGAATALNRYSAFFSAGTHVQFYTMRAIEQTGFFDERLGPASGFPYGSGEDTDYLLRALKAGLRVVRNPEMVVCHHAPNWNDGRFSAKWRSYGYGRMYVLHKHGVPLWFQLLNVLYPLARLCIEGPSAWTYRKTMFLGRWQGLWNCGKSEKEKDMKHYAALRRLVNRLYPMHVKPMDEILLNCVFDENVNQQQLDLCLGQCDIEALGGAKCLLLSYLMQNHSELRFPEYSGPRIRGLINFWRFRNLKTLAHFSKIGRALNAAGIPILLFKGGAMKYLRPELPRTMGDVDIFIPRDGKNEAVKICCQLGYLLREDASYAIGFHTPSEDAVDVHFGLYDQGPDLEALYKGLWARAVPCKAFGVDVLLPCHEDLFFLVLSNFTKNLRNHTSLKGLYISLCDCRFLMQNKPDFNWELVREDARNSGKELEVRFGVEFMNSIVPNILPLDKLNMPVTPEMEDFCNQVIFDEDIFLNLQKECQAIRVVELKNHPLREGRRIARFLLLKQLRKHPLLVRLYFKYVFQGGINAR